MDLVTEEVARPGPEEVTVEAIGSLVSRGTEMLAFRGELPPDMPLGLRTAAGSARFPTKYGYQVVGHVVEAGEGVELSEGDVVFARHPHQTLFTLPIEGGYVRRLPDGIAISDALFLNLVEVALTAMHDAAPRHGDVIVVFGLGVVGTVAALLAQDVGTVIAVDPLLRRREAARSLGITDPIDPDDLGDRLGDVSRTGHADVVVEVTGNPDTLQRCIEVCGTEGTIAVVSFYGARTTNLHLNPSFHFRRQRIISSQVGAVGSGLQPRWDRTRRFEVSASYARKLGVGRLLSHEAPIERAQVAYRLLDEEPHEVVALAFNYGGRRLQEGAVDV